MRQPERRWTVPAGKRGRLAEVVHRGLDDVGEVARDGRLFVNGRRVDDARITVAAGDLVEVYPARRTQGKVHILERRSGWLAVDKPAELPTEPDHSGSDSVVAQAAALEALPVHEVHALSRLDVGVSGVVVLACTRAARQRGEYLRRAGHFRRAYAAIATGRCDGEGTWSIPVRGREAHTRFVTCQAPRPTSNERAQLVALAPLTGRTHQLRVQASEAGAPLVGDRRYGGMVRLIGANGRVNSMRRILLHCIRVALGDESSRRWTVQSQLPAAFGEAWTMLGGADNALELFAQDTLWSRLWTDR